MPEAARNMRLQYDRRTRLRAPRTWWLAFPPCVLVQFIADDNCADRNHRPHPRDSGNGLVGRTSRESLSAEEPTVQELGHCLNAPVPPGFILYGHRAGRVPRSSMTVVPPLVPLSWHSSTVRIRPSASVRTPNPTLPITTPTPGDAGRSSTICIASWSH